MIARFKKGFENQVRSFKSGKRPVLYYGQTYNRLLTSSDQGFERNWSVLTTSEGQTVEQEL